MAFILAFDQGTTSSRSIIFDHDGNIIATAQREITQHYPRPGWVEHDPVEIYETQIATALIALDSAGLSPPDIAAIGITNQRETTVVWDRSIGRPLTNAIVWQDRRTSDICDYWRTEHGEFIRRHTGLEVDAYFSASKVAWILENVNGARRLAESGQLAFGTIDSWLIWNLTHGAAHIIDTSNASRTMMFDIAEMTWSDKLLNIYAIPHTLLPTVVDSALTDDFVVADERLNGIHIASVIGDQQAALFGQSCFNGGSAKNTYGTGCFMLKNIGHDPRILEQRLLTTVGWTIGGKSVYANEGSVFIGGAVIQWLRDSLGLIESAADVEQLAASVTDCGGVMFVPAFSGLGTPYWDQNARGTIIGLTRGTTRAHIARAAVESIAFQTAELVEAFDSEPNLSMQELRVDGGASANSLLLQTQADLLQIPVVRSAITETTALGAAYLAGHSVGIWPELSDIEKLWRFDAIFEPAISADEASGRMAEWKRAVARSFDWACE